MGFLFGGNKTQDSNRFKSQHAGGMLLPPVQKLVATLIKSSPVVSAQTIANQPNMSYTNYVTFQMKLGEL